MWLMNTFFTLDPFSIGWTTADGSKGVSLMTSHIVIVTILYLVTHKKMTQIVSVCDYL
jgi:hypothetical protein